MHIFNARYQISASCAFKNLVKVLYKLANFVPRIFHESPNPYFFPLQKSCRVT